MIHELKIWPQYFHKVKDGSKTFEVRENDRGFQCGDTVILREYDPGQTLSTIGLYTGKEIKFKIGYILPIDDHRVVFSLLKLDDEKDEGNVR